MTECIFCKIVSGNIPCMKLAETENSIAFLDIAPLNKGHTLVIPKKHAENLFEMNENQLIDIAKIAHKLAPAIKSATKCEGLNLIQNNGRIAHQFVMHFHLHLIPRFNNDKFGFTWPAGSYAKDEIQEMQKRILKELK